MRRSAKKLHQAGTAAGKAAAQAEKAVLRGVEAGQEAIKEARSEVSGQVHLVAERAKEFGGGARERYQEAVGELEGRYEQARKSVEDLAGDVGQYVRDNPGRSMVAASGIGFLLGLTLTRKHRYQDSES